jgi:hypothetical protein
MNKLVDPMTRRDLIAVGVGAAFLVWNVGSELNYNGWAAAGTGAFVGWIIYALGATILLHIDRSIAQQVREIVNESEARIVNESEARTRATLSTIMLLVQPQGTRSLNELFTFKDDGAAGA